MYVAIAMTSTCTCIHVPIHTQLTHTRTHTHTHTHTHAHSGNELLEVSSNGTVADPQLATAPLRIHPNAAVRISC